jgi:flagellar biosynthesis protein FlhB
MNQPEGDRIHPPTPRRRTQARQQGQVARSRDLVAAGVLLAALAAAWMQGAGLVEWISDLAVQQLGGNVPIDADPAVAVDLGRQTILQMGAVLLPVLGILFLASVVSQVGQFGILFLPEKLTPDFQRVNPVANWQRLAAADSLVRTAAGLLKLAVVLAVAGWSVWSLRWEILDLGAVQGSAMVAGAAWVIGNVALRVLVAVVALGLADFAYQRWRYEQQLWMTEEEHREEARDDTSARRGHQRRQHRQQIAQQSIGPEVARSDVILIAGNSIAVAVQYAPDTMPAPRVLVKGTGPMAVEIYRLARHHGKWIVDDRKLTRELYRRVPAGQEPPADMYPAVARTLAELPRYANV